MDRGRGISSGGWLYLARHLHDFGMYHQDFYLGHIYLGPDKVLSLIDLQRVLHFPAASLRYQIKDLAQLNYSTLEIPGITTADRLRFLLSYLGSSKLGPSERKMIERIGGRPGKSPFTRPNSWREEDVAKKFHEFIFHHHCELEYPRPVEDCLSPSGTIYRKPFPQVIVVDNGSADGSAAMVESRFPEVRLLASPTNLGFARANNPRPRKPRVIFCCC